jgi:hypothetical protein
MDALFSHFIHASIPLFRREGRVSHHLFKVGPGGHVDRNATIRNSSRRSGWDISKDWDGAASPPFVLRPTDFCPNERQFPLRRSCHHDVPAICLTRRLPAQRIRRCGLNATFRTRLQRCDGDCSPLSPRLSHVVHRASLGTDTETK